MGQSWISWRFRSFTKWLRSGGPTKLLLILAVSMTGIAVEVDSILAAPDEESDTPSQLVGDRGGQIPTSLFGTYISHREFLLYPFYEYTTNQEAEYNPSEFGAPLDQEFFGKQTDQEILIFLGYGFTNRFALEIEAAVWAKSELETSTSDTSGLPPRIEESGLGDVETQLRWLWTDGPLNRPLFYSFWELVFPFQSDKLILGTQDWETALGFGYDQVFRWGTLDGRVSIKYDEADGQVEPGEYAVEYVKRTSDRWKWIASVEGEDDEVSVIGEAQLTLGRLALLKLNLGIGVTEKAPDFAPEIGVIFSF